MNETCIIFQKIDCFDLIRYMEQTSVLDFLHKNLSCREFLIFKLINDFEMELNEIVDTQSEGVPKGDIKNLIDTFKITSTQKWLNRFEINKTIYVLINLEELCLSHNEIVDISPLRNLTNLQKLYLNNNKIVDISPLQSLKNLQHLYLNNNNIVDISSLQNLKNLQYLRLESNKIVDVTPLQNLTNLRLLWVPCGSIVDMTPLQNLKLLVYLEC